MCVFVAGHVPLWRTQCDALAQACESAHALRFCGWSLTVFSRTETVKTVDALRFRLQRFV